jgi:hypothetical protein
MNMDWKEFLKLTGVKICIFLVLFIGPLLIKIDAPYTGLGGGGSVHLAGLYFGLMVVFPPALVLLGLHVAVLYIISCLIYSFFRKLKK